MKNSYLETKYIVVMSHLWSRGCVLTGGVGGGRGGSWNTDAWPSSSLNLN